MSKKIKTIYRKYREMTEEEEQEKFGFTQIDLFIEGAWLSPACSELYKHERLIAEDVIIYEEN